MKHRPDVAAKLILRCGKEILMLQHHKGANDFPGGRIEWSETPEEALKRELKEELNYSLPGNPRFFDVWNYISKDKKRHSIFLYYFLRISRKPDLKSLEGAHVHWHSKKDFALVISSAAFVKKIFSLKNAS